MCRVPGCGKIYKNKRAEQKHYLSVHHKYDSNDEARRKKRTARKPTSKYEAHFKCPICQEAKIFLAALKRHVHREHPETSWETLRLQIGMFSGSNKT